jgi:ATP-dependent Clp protease ATP-binding subunit ClpA
MSEAFSELSRTILNLAHVEAIRLDHEQVAPAHLLLALLREGTNRPGELLRRLNVSVDKVRIELKKIVGDTHPEKHSYPIPYTEDLKTAIKIAVEESRLSGTPGPVEPEHLLEGLLRDERHTPVKILRNLGVNLDDKRIVEDMRVAFLKRRAPNAPQPAMGMDVTLRRDHLERFSDQARKVMQLAHEEAHRLQHGHIGTEHILLGIVNNGHGAAAHVLRTLGIELTTTRTEVEKMVGSAAANKSGRVRLPYTLPVREAIDLAWEEAEKLKQEQIETEHLLLGLLRMENGGARKVLVSLGFSPEHIHSEVLGQFREPG